MKLFYPKITVEGAENLPDEPVIIVGNHCQMNGPIVGELYVPGEPYIWCAGEMMHLKDVPEYAFRDFWSQKPKWTHPFDKASLFMIPAQEYSVTLTADFISDKTGIGFEFFQFIQQRFKNILYRLAARQAENINQDKPTHKFIRKLYALLERNQAYVDDKNNPGELGFGTCLLKQYTPLM